MEKSRNKNGPGFVWDEKVVNGQREPSKFEKRVMEMMRERMMEQAFGTSVVQEETIDIECEIIEEDETVNSRRRALG
jgi:ribonuclease PH